VRRFLTVHQHTKGRLVAYEDYKDMTGFQCDT